MAFKIVDGKLVRTTDFGTAAQKAAGRKITGTLGVISGPKTKQAAARKISEVFNPPPQPDTSGPFVSPPSTTSGDIVLGPGPVTRAPTPTDQISAGGNVQNAIRASALQQILKQSGGITGTLGLESSAPSQPVTGGRGGDPRQFGINQRAQPQAALPPSAQTPGGREIRHRPAAPTTPPGAVPPATEQHLSYLDRIREVDPDRALEQARFQSATISNNDPDTALATNVFFTEHALYDQGQIPRNATEAVWDAIAERGGFEGTGAELLESLGYIPIGGGLWFLPDEAGGVADGGGIALGPITTRAPIFSGQPGRFSGTRGASLGLTNWRI